MNHPEPELLIRFADGEQVDAVTAAHLDGCDECRAALAELGALAARVASATPIATEDRRQMHAATTRLLARPAVLPGHRWRMTGLVVALAAGLFALVSLWPSQPGCTIGVRRYDPPGDVRADRMERFQLDVELTAARWLSLWRLETVGPAERLMPNADPMLRYLFVAMPLAAGSHRVPGSELFDFEFSTKTPPTALLLVPTAVELSAAEVAGIEAVLASTPLDQLLTAVTARHAEAQVIPFPSR